MSRINICRVTSAVYPDVVGGHAVYCHELSIRQSKVGYNIHLITSERRGLPFREQISRGYVVYRLGRVCMPWDYLSMENPVLPSLPSYVKDIDFDLVDAHSHLFLTSAMAVKTAKRCRIPSIVTVHGVRALRGSFVNLSQEIYLRSVGNWLFKNASKIICLTDQDKLEIIGLGAPKNRIEVIPVAVDTDKFKPSYVDQNYLLWIGRLVPEKGINYLLKLIEEIGKRKRDLKIMVIGEGPLGAYMLRNVNRFENSNNITMSGFKSQEDISTLIQHCTAFVSTSLKEGMPKTVLEAMSCGKAVVAFKLPSLHEVIGDKGLLVNVGDIDKMVKAVIELAEDKNLRIDLGTKARHFVEKKYNWNTAMEKIRKVYEEVLSR